MSNPTPATATVTLSVTVTHAQATAILAYLSGNLGGKSKAEPATPAAAVEKPAAVEKKAPESAPAKTKGEDEPRSQAKKAPESAPATAEPAKIPGKGKRVVCSLDPLDTDAGTKCWSFKFKGTPSLALPKGWASEDKDGGIVDAYVKVKNATSDEYESRREALGAALAAAGVKKIEWNEDDADLLEVITAPDDDDGDDGDDADAVDG